MVKEWSQEDVERLYESIDQVTAEEIQQVALDLFCPDQMLTLVYR